MSLLDLLNSESDVVQQITEYVEADTVKAIAELFEQAKPLMEVKRQYALATAEMKQQISMFQENLAGLQQQLTDLTSKLERMEDSKREINALEKQLLTKLLSHPELNK